MTNAFMFDEDLNPPSIFSISYDFKLVYKCFGAARHFVQPQLFTAEIGPAPLNALKLASTLSRKYASKSNASYVETEKSFVV